MLTIGEDEAMEDYDDDPNPPSGEPSANNMRMEVDDQSEPQDEPRLPDPGYDPRGASNTTPAIGLAEKDARIQDLLIKNLTTENTVLTLKLQLAKARGQLKRNAEMAFYTEDPRIRAFKKVWSTFSDTKTHGETYKEVLTWTQRINGKFRIYNLEHDAGDASTTVTRDVIPTIRDGCSGFAKTLIESWENQADLQELLTWPALQKLLMNFLLPEKMRPVTMAREFITFKYQGGDTIHGHISKVHSRENNIEHKGKPYRMPESFRWWFYFNTFPRYIREDLQQQTEKWNALSDLADLESLITHRLPALTAQTKDKEKNKGKDKDKKLSADKPTAYSSHVDSPLPSHRGGYQRGRGDRSDRGGRGSVRGG